MSIHKENSVNSFFGLPPPLEEDHFSHAFHQTPFLQSLITPQNPTSIFNNNPFNLLDSITKYPSQKTQNVENHSSGLNPMSCTENLGFESSDEMISNFADLGFFKNCNPRKKSGESSSSSSSLNCRGLRREKRVIKSEFPPPLTTFDENRKQDFVMRSVRENGRLTIVGVMIERPEFLCATRSNGRLRMNLVQSVSPSSDDDEDVDDVNDDDDDGNEDHDHHDCDGDGDDGKEVMIPAKGGVVRRCYEHHHPHQNVWGPQRSSRCVTTI